MSRIIEVTVPSKLSDRVIESVSGLDGVVSMEIYRNASLMPAGDIIKITTTNKSLPNITATLNEQGVGDMPATNITTSEPLSVTSPSNHSQIINDTSDSNWEEMEQVIAKESNSSANMLGLMFVAGVIAVFGIASNALHLVIGAMIIAPGFEPFVRVGLGVANANIQVIRRGVRDILKGYAALAAGAGLAATILPHFGFSEARQTSSYLSSPALLDYWTTINPTLIIVTIMAAIAGSLLIASNRSTITAGVMVALALVPATAIAMIGVVEFDIDLVKSGFSSLLLQIGLLTMFSALVFIYKRWCLHRRTIKS